MSARVFANSILCQARAPSLLQQLGWAACGEASVAATASRASWSRLWAAAHAPQQLARSHSASGPVARRFASLIGSAASATAHASAKACAKAVGLAKAADARRYASSGVQFWQRNSFSLAPRRPTTDQVLYGIIGANFLGYVAWQVNPVFMLRNALLATENLEAGRVWCLLTHAFSHHSSWHFGGNMLTFYFFGRTFASYYGPRKLLGLYVVGALAGAAAHLGYSWYGGSRGSLRRGIWLGQAPPALGASASVNALVVASICTSPTSIYLLYGIIPVPAWVLGVGWLALDISGAQSGRSNVGHAAHLGGAAAGLLFYVGVRTGRIRFRW